MNCCRSGYLLQLERPREKNDLTIKLAKKHLFNVHQTGKFQTLVTLAWRPLVKEKSDERTTKLKHGRIVKFCFLKQTFDQFCLKKLLPFPVNEDCIEKTENFANRKKIFLCSLI